MKEYNIVGKNSFTSKSGKTCRLIYTTFEVEPFGNMQGKMTKEFFLNDKLFAQCDVGDIVHLLFNDKGFVESVEVIG